MTDIQRALMVLHNYCHHIHRDLKPENILMQESGHWAVADFGISRVHSAHSARHTPLVLRYWYASVETHAGNYSFSVDIYSYGLIYLSLSLKVLNDLARLSQFEVPNSNYFCLSEEEKTTLFEGMDHLDETFVRWCTITNPSRRPSLGQVEQFLSKKELPDENIGVDDVGIDFHAYIMYMGTKIGPASNFQLDNDAYAFAVDQHGFPCIINTRYILAAEFSDPDISSKVRDELKKLTGNPYTRLYYLHVFPGHIADKGSNVDEEPIIDEQTRMSVESSFS
jgi:serine/threonine protein kinase